MEDQQYSQMIVIDPSTLEESLRDHSVVPWCMLWVGLVTLWEVPPLAVVVGIGFAWACNKTSKKVPRPKLGDH